MSTPYPRDMIGYGRAGYDPKWPDGAVIAVQFVVNYEEGGENNILHGDAASEAFLSEVVGAQPWLGQRHMSMESIYEYGSRAGFWRLHRLFTDRSILPTVFGVAMAMERNPEAVAAMKEADWEIASHGLRWIDYRDFTEAAERDHLRQAIDLHTRVTGARPLGIYTGRTSVHSIDLAAEEGGFVYCADSYADDLPYWIDSPRGPFLIVPYTLDANDMRFATAQGFNSGDQFFAYLRDSFDTLYAEGERGAPKMMSVGCTAALRAGRAARRRWRVSSTTLRRRTGSGCQGASTSPGTGTRTTSRGSNLRGLSLEQRGDGRIAQKLILPLPAERHQRGTDVAPALVAITRGEHGLDGLDQPACLGGGADRVGVFLAALRAGLAPMPDQLGYAARVDIGGGRNASDGARLQAAQRCFSAPGKPRNPGTTDHLRDVIEVAGGILHPDHDVREC